MEKNKFNLMKEIMKTNVCLWMLAGLLVMGCKTDDDQGPSQQVEYSFDFSNSAEGWTGDFADYPAGEEDFYELEFSYTTLPAPLDETQGALMLSGRNYSDDLFMFVKREITGLVPNKEYTMQFFVRFATNVPEGMVGIGGSPGESVYIKAGASTAEPIKVLEEDGYFRMNIDKGNQSQEGEDMLVIGNFSNEIGEEVYSLKSLSNTTNFRATASSQGSLWIIVGTDSGFEGQTTIYIDSIEVILTD